MHIAILPGSLDPQDEGTTIFRSRGIMITLTTMLIYWDARVFRIYI